MDNREQKKFLIKKNQILTGSFFLKNKKINSYDRESYMIKNMLFNKALIFRSKKENISAHSLLPEFVEKYKSYRRDWKQQPEAIINEKDYKNFVKYKKSKPLCLDIEVASVCDLACPFCYREHVVTPDKIIKDDLCYQLIDQASDLKIPSIKFNWRGEPLLNPKIYNYIKYAKEKGILETIINTNATQLTEENSKKLIDAGLDLIIYSFDGGTAKTYEKMRPGRFKKNSFSEVYENIKNFKKVRENENSKLPFTKIQMILTEETIKEADNFFNLFNEYVDEVTVNQYTERGGNISELGEKEQTNYKSLLKKYNLPEGTPYMRDLFGNLKVSKKRKPCEQPFQRLLVTYEGRVAMCCYDWGATHPVGYVDNKAFKNQSEYDQVLNSVKNDKKGFELLKNIKMPKTFNNPKEKVEKIEKIWFGDEINSVRRNHCSNQGENVPICKNCTFKDVYHWTE